MSAGAILYENKATNTTRRCTMSGQTLFLRLAVFSGMVAVVLTILYFTPMPGENFQSCERPCHDLDWPMICRLKLTIEMYQTMTNDCTSCFSNNTITNCSNPNCILANGIPRTLITADRKLPGPGIHVCQNDILVIDVVNKIPGHSITIHWRGQTQEETPFMDGVPMITQCPISSYTTFQYRFRAGVPGTHLWEGYSGMTRENGLFGALVVRQPDKWEPHRHLYDYDKNEHILVVSTLSKQFMLRNIYDTQEDNVDSLLLNGKSLQMFETTVKPGKRYRFRIAYGSGSHTCGIKLSIERHALKVIAIDGHAIAPSSVNSVTLSRGERLDFVLYTNNTEGTFGILAETVNCRNEGIRTEGVIRYEGEIVGKVVQVGNSGSDLVLNNFCESLRDGSECVDTTKSLEKLPIVLRDPSVKRKIFLSFSGSSTFKQANEIGLMGMNNFTFMFPSSPMLSQWSVSVNTCNADNIPNYCKQPLLSRNSYSCECTYVEKIQLGDTVELIISDLSGDSNQHIFHLHGYSFWVVGVRQFPNTVSLEEIQELEDRDMLFNRNLLKPLRKDTIAIPKNGIVAVRFKADNPGYWLFRQEHSSQWTKGADVILQVGKREEFVPVPVEFPSCGDYVGPTFFLA